jgi:hypothetical protein
VKLVAVASLLFVGHALMRLAGFADHASAIVGMGDHAIEGALFVGSYLVAVLVAPVLMIAGALDAFFHQASRTRRSQNGDGPRRRERRVFPERADATRG